MDFSLGKIDCSLNQKIVRTIMNKQMSRNLQGYLNQICKILELLHQILIIEMKQKSHSVLEQI